MGAKSVLSIEVWGVRKKFREVEVVTPRKTHTGAISKDTALEQILGRSKYTAAHQFKASVLFVFHPSARRQTNAITAHIHRASLFCIHRYLQWTRSRATRTPCTRTHSPLRQRAGHSHKLQQLVSALPLKKRVCQFFRTSLSNIVDILLP